MGRTLTSLILLFSAFGLFAEQTLRVECMERSQALLDRFAIRAGLWPARFAGRGAGPYSRYFELIWQEGGGQGLELRAANIPLAEDPAQDVGPAAGNGWLPDAEGDGAAGRLPPARLAQGVQGLPDRHGVLRPLW